MSIQLLDQPIEEKIVTLRCVSWEQFKAIEAQLENNREAKLTCKYFGNSFLLPSLSFLRVLRLFVVNYPLSF